MEALLILPGVLYLDEEKSVLKDGVLKPVYKPDDQLAELIKVCKQCMIDAMSEVLNGFPGGASADAAPYWAH